MATPLHGQEAIAWVKQFFAQDLNLSDPDRPRQVWTVFTLLAQGRNVCAYFWVETYRSDRTGLDLGRLQAVAQKFADEVRRTGRVSPKANEYLTYLQHRANWADHPAGETGTANTTEMIEQFLDDIREDDDQAN